MCLPPLAFFYQRYPLAWLYGRCFVGGKLDMTAD
jgi:hypothetical protein